MKPNPIGVYLKKKIKEKVTRSDQTSVFGPTFRVARCVKKGEGWKFSIHTTRLH